MKKIMLLLLFVPIFSFAIETNFLCSGEEIKSINGDLSTQRAFKKVIGIQVYQKGMRLDGEWFDKKKDLTDDYSVEGNYSKTKDEISSKRKFLSSSRIKDKVIQSIKIDKVEINLHTTEINWKHKFNRVDVTNDEDRLIYAYRKIFKGTCKKK